MCACADHRLPSVLTPAPQLNHALNASSTTFLAPHSAYRNSASPSRFASNPRSSSPTSEYLLVVGIFQADTRRTFLSWLHFAVVLGGLAVGLLNFSDDKVGG